MKRLLPLLLLAAMLTWGAADVGNHASTSGASCPMSTGAVDTSSASYLWIALANYGTACSSITPSDSVGGNSNTWTLRAGYTGSATVAYCVWTAPPTYAGSGHTFTATGCQYASIVGGALTGTSATPVDQVNTGDGYPNTATVLAHSGVGDGVTPTENSELILAVEGDNDYGNGDPSIDTGTLVHDVTAVNNVNQGIHVFKYVQTTAAAYNPTVTGTGSVTRGLGLVSFKEAAGAPPAGVRRRVIISQ